MQRIIHPVNYLLMHPMVSPLMRHGVAGGDSRLAAAL